MGPAPWSFECFPRKSEIKGTVTDFYFFKMASVSAARKLERDNDFVTTTKKYSFLSIEHWALVDVNLEDNNLIKVQSKFSQMIEYGDQTFETLLEKETVNPNKVN